MLHALYHRYHPVIQSSFVADLDNGSISMDMETVNINYDIFFT